METQTVTAGHLFLGEPDNNDHCFFAFDEGEGRNRRRKQAYCGQPRESKEHVRAAIEDIRQRIAALPEDALGRNEKFDYFFRDELLMKFDALLEDEAVRF